MARYTTTLELHYNSTDNFTVVIEASSPGAAAEELRKLHNNHQLIPLLSSFGSTDNVDVVAQENGGTGDYWIPPAILSSRLESALNEIVNPDPL